MMLHCYVKNKSNFTESGQSLQIMACFMTVCYLSEMQRVNDAQVTEA